MTTRCARCGLTLLPADQGIEVKRSDGQTMRLPLDEVWEEAVCTGFVRLPDIPENADAKIGRAHV